jgi:CRP-like cAMP-binding protein
MRDGNTAEVVTVGREGMLGLSSVLNPGFPEPGVTATVGGTALVLPGPRLSELLRDAPDFGLTLLRYTAAHLFLVGLTSACNRLHDVRSRLARWLLLMDDRLTAPGVLLTHDALAEALGVRRPSISLAAVQLQAQGAIAYSRGRLEVRDRPRLAAASCECYGEMRRALSALIAQRSA